VHRVLVLATSVALLLLLQLLLLLLPPFVLLPFYVVWVAAVMPLLLFPVPKRLPLLSPQRRLS